MRNRDISKDKQARKCKNNNMKRKEKMIRESGREERMGEDGGVYGNRI